ncbi:TPA: hypothetical protein ACGX73_001656 [Listeria monocytogenes]|uniref:hypothetical protein n=1 Tax=Listeria monocytogenes TaxID=1639 RepID=UPI0010B4B9C2|nr:hypothetical protein [Listeria monocytogenes]EAE3061555.1 hypothetical protein [Listeria monocytogenes]EAH2959089.1 hypothetical protein [Listeria monocytogenes]EAW0596482.1 hypothetical protein [Listeria monocytogenes]NJA41657.1 hypothetical protein [Listeria monocytogenes]QEZ22051.1 hypothetical protein DRA52_11450 [Listeria monocytogenes]
MEYEQFYRYDKNGDYLESVLVFKNENGEIIQPDSTTEIEPSIIENGIARAMYYPRWNGEDWDEDKKRWELENPIIPAEKTEIEKLREELLLTQEALAALFESNLG